MDFTPHILIVKVHSLFGHAQGPRLWLRMSQTGSYSHGRYVLDVNEASECLQSANDSHAPVRPQPFKRGAQGGLSLPVLIKTKRSRVCPVVCFPLPASGLVPVISVA